MLKYTLFNVNVVLSAVMSVFCNTYTFVSIAEPNCVSVIHSIVSCQAVYTYFANISVDWYCNSCDVRHFNFVDEDHRLVVEFDKW